MNELGLRARGLIARVGDTDGPPAGTRERVRASLGAAVGAGALASSTTAFGASASGKTAAATGLLGLTGKTGTTILLFLLAGAAAGVAVTAPVAFFAGREPSPASSRQVTAPVERAPLVPRATTRANVDVVEEPGPRIAAPDRPVRAPVAKVISPQQNAAPPREEPPPSASVGNMATVVAGNGSPSTAMATELSLLKSAQRELNAGNAEASLALLDEHARRYPAGALRVERLGARVFALCQLGRVDAARTAAREFFASAADSPLVPRVAASCAGSGNGAR